MECGTLIERKKCRSVSIIEQGLVILRINTTRQRGCTLDPEHSCEDPLETASRDGKQTAQHHVCRCFLSSGSLCLAVSATNYLPSKPLLVKTRQIT